MCLVQYYLEDEPHPVFPRAHGNSKNEKRYACSLKSLQEKLKLSGGKAIPKEVLTQTLEESGGLVHARSAGSIPKNRSQVRLISPITK